MPPKEQIGTYSCWSCGKEVPVKKTSTGKLSAPCPWCDFPHYANEGTEHFRRLMAKVTVIEKPAAPKPPAAVKPEPKPAPTKPAAAPSSNPFAR